MTSVDPQGMWTLIRIQNENKNNLKIENDATHRTRTHQPTVLQLLLIKTFANDRNEKEDRHMPLGDM